MKKYNFLDEPPDDEPFEMDEGPKGLSPAAKRLVVIGIIGILLAGGLYVYTTFFAGTPPPPAPAVAVREPIQRPLSPPPPPKQPEAPQEPFRPSAIREETVTSAQVREEPPTSPAPPTAATQETQRPVTPPETKAPQESPPQAKATTAESSPPAEPREKPAAEPQVKPQPQAKAEKPSPEPRREVEKPAPQAVAKAPTSPETVETWYAVQVASLVRGSNAVSLQKRLGDMGYTPDVHTVTARITHHRVYVGEWSSREEAERTGRQLNVDGFPSKVISLPGGKFALEAGSFLRLNEAIDLAHKLQTKDHTAKIVSERVPTPVHQVRVGKYASRAEADKALEALKGKGFKPLVVKH